MFASALLRHTLRFTVQNSRPRSIFSSDLCKKRVTGQTQLLYVRVREIVSSTSIFLHDNATKCIDLTESIRSQLEVILTQKY